jgi:hypothetical protein
VALPTLKFELAPNAYWLDSRTIYSSATGAAPWVDYSTLVMSGSINRGRSYELDEMEAGTFELLLDNSAGTIDLTSATWRPGMKARISTIYSGVTQRQFVGFVERFEPDRSDPTNRYAGIRVTGSDAFTMLANASWSQKKPGRIKLGVWRWNQPLGNASFVPGLTFHSPDEAVRLYAEVTDCIPWQGISFHVDDLKLKISYTDGGGSANRTVQFKLAGGQKAVTGDGDSPKQWDIHLGHDGTIRSMQKCVWKLSGSSLVEGYKMHLNFYGERARIPKGRSDLQFKAVLQAYGWPKQDILLRGNGQATLTPTTPDAGSAVELLQSITESEIGLIFVARDGRIVFEPRGWRYNNWGTPTVYGDGGGAEIPYESIQTSKDWEQVINRWDVTREPRGDNDQPIAQRAQDTVSQRRYGVRSGERSPRIFGDAEALKQAKYLLGKASATAATKDSLYRIPSLTVKPDRVSTNWPAILAHDISDPVTVKERPPGVATVSTDCRIEGIQHEFAPDDWATTFQLSPRETKNPATYGL